MAHYLEVNDAQGDLYDLITFCSDACHWGYCQDNDVEYEGWNGCHELEYNALCVQCHDTVPGVRGEWEGLL